MATTIRDDATISTPPAAMMSMADPNMTSLQDVQRELDAIKAERRRRQRAMYDAIRPPANVLKKYRSSVSDKGRFPAATQAPISVNALGCPEKGDARMLPYRPDTSIPLQLLTMAYQPRPGGRLSLCPSHCMGSLVEALDLSPWDMSSIEQGNEIWSNNRRLRSLKLSGRSFELDQEGDLRTLSRVGLQLTSLELSDCSGVTEKALRILSPISRQLTNLDLSGCIDMRDEHVTEVARNCSSVTSLDLSSWVGLTDQGLASAASSGSLSSLQRLLVSKCPGVGDLGLRGVLDNCFALRELSAGGCNGVTGRAFLDKTYAGGAFATAPVRCLQRLELPDCRQLDQSAVEWITAGCTDLRSLVVSGCVLTKPEGVELLAASHPDLLELSVAGCVELGASTALSFVAEHSGRCLRHLDISDIPATAAAVVGRFLRTCGRLESVDLSGLPKVDRSCFSGLGGQGGSHKPKDDDHYGGSAGADPRLLVDPSIIKKRCIDIGEGLLTGDVNDSRAGVNRTPALPHLRQARMLRLPNLDDVGIVRLANACPILEELLVSDSPLVTGACLPPLAFLCPRLRSLGLDRCAAASDEAALATAFEGLSGLESLGIGVALGNENRRDQHLFQGEHLKRGHPLSSGISSSEIRGQGNDSRVPSRRAPYGGGGCDDRLVETPLSPSSPPSAALGVRPLHSDQGAVTPFTGQILLAAASRHCTKLATLGLEGHQSFTFSSEHSPAGAFPCLTELRLVGCAALNDAGLLVLLRACPRVSSLSLSGSGVSHEALAGHAATLPSLSWVEVLPPAPITCPVRRSGESRSTDSSSRVVPATGLLSKAILAGPSPPPPPSEGRHQPFNTEEDQGPPASTNGALATTITTAVAANPRIGGCSTTSTGGSVASGMNSSGRNASIMARGLRPAAHHKLHMAAAAVLSRFDEEEQALEVLGRALRKFRDRRSEILMSKARVICRWMLAYRFRTSDDQPDKIRLALARKAAKLIQGLVRTHRERKRDAAAAGFQSVWRRYTSRCMFVHQLRLSRAAIGVQRLWRGHYVRTRYRVREKIKELNQAKKMLGKKWFKQAAALKNAELDPARSAAEKERREEIRVGVSQCAKWVRSQRNCMRTAAALKCQPILENEELVSFGAMPPAPRRTIVPGGFDAHPTAKRLRDGREVPFDGEANLTPPPAREGAAWASLPSSARKKGGARVESETVALGSETVIRDPADFDVFRKGPGELWDGNKGGADEAKAATERASAAVRAMEPKESKKKMLCSLCQGRFASISCKECRRGYCSRCSGNVHSQPARLGHDLSPFQRLEQPNSTSERDLAGGHGKKRDVKKAKIAARTLPDCARRAEGFLKSMKLLKYKESIKADEQRVKMKAKDRREMEELAERERKAKEEYSRASAGENNAATMIQRSCKGYMSKLRFERESELRHRAQADSAKLKMKNTVTRVQALFRGFSVRLFLKQSAGKAGPAFMITGSTTSTKADVPPSLPVGIGMRRDKTAAASRVKRDCASRRRWEREAAIAEMKHLEEDVGRTFVSDVRWAVHKHEEQQAESSVLKRRRVSSRSAWNRLQEEQSLLDPDLPPEDPEKRRLAKEIERQNIRIQHEANFHEIVEKGLYWTRAFIRQHYRRHAAHLASKAGASYTFAWLEEELYALDEVVNFASSKLETVADVLEQEFFRSWLTDQVTRAGRQRLMIDLEQESLLETETARLSKQKLHNSKCRETLEELLKAYRIDTQLGAERVGTELASAAAEEGTDEKFMWLSRLTKLKNKEESVRGKVQLSLQRGLEEQIAAEDGYLNEEVKISGDVADAPIAHFTEIKASLMEPPHHPAHLAFESWRKVYRAQPWLAAQTQAENKRKAVRASTIEGLEEMRAVVASAKSQEAFAAKEVTALKAEIEQLEKRLTFSRSGTPGDAAQEPLSDHERTRMEIDLAKGQEKLVDKEERLERRRKANSHKDEELKKREQDLEAEITAEEERHARQAAAMAAFRAAERDDTAAQFGKDQADAAVDRMKARLEKLKTIQGSLAEPAPGKQKEKAKKGLISSLVGFALGTDGEIDEESRTQELDYAEQTQLIAKKAKLALVNRQIEELIKAKKTISLDYASADAQLMLAEDMLVGDERGQEAAAEAQKLQTRVREAKQRAIEAKEQQKKQQRQSKEEKAAQKAKEAKAKAEVDMAKRVAEEMGMGHVGKTNNVMLSAKRIKRKIVGGKTTYGANFDNENAAVEAAIKTKHKTKLGKVEAVVDFAFTVGTDETDGMASKQARLNSQGLPSFRKLTKGIGGKEGVFLWIRKTLDSSEFVTEVQVTHADPANAGYKNLKPLGFTSWGHPRLAAKVGGQPSILLWGKRDPHSDGIADFDISYNMADEKKLSDVGFKLVPGLLVDCGLPDVRLWYSTIKRGAHTLPTVKAILHEIGEVRQMRKQNPGDGALMDVEAKLESKLAQAREAEERKAEDRSNPLKSAIETYALTGMDVDVFISHFAAIDVDRQGTIEIGAFFEYFEWPRNAFANHLFSFMESADEDGRVDFGDFVKLVCSYCMFGKSDLLRYAYTVYDQGKGYVSFDDLMSLLNDVHKTNSGPIERALRDADIARIGQLSFSHFLDLDKRFPKMFYPVANLQLEMRKRFLGEAFWVKKMLIFNEARGNIIKEADGSASKALKAKLREEEIAYIKAKTKKAFAATKKNAKMATNRARQKIEGSKWMSKLLST